METAATMIANNFLLLPKCKNNLSFKDDLHFRFTRQVYSKPRPNYNGRHYLCCISPYKMQQHSIPIHREINKRGPQEETYKAYRRYFGMLRNADRDKSLAMTKMVHGQLIKSGMDSEIDLCNYELSLYTKLQKDIEDVEKLFEAMEDLERDDVCWTTMISAYAKHNMVKECLQHFVEMLNHGIIPNTFTFTTVVPVLATLRQCKQVHSSILKHPYVKYVGVENVLISTYSKFGDLRAARKVFDNMGLQDTGSWNAIIGSYARNRLCNESFKMFVGMLRAGIQPQFFSISSALTTVVHLEQGKQIHAVVIKLGFGCNLFVGNSLLNMYSKHGRGAEFASRVFVNMPEKDEISWAGMVSAFTRSGKMHNALDLIKRNPERSLMVYNSMLSGLVHNKEEENACRLFHKMIKAGLKVDKFTFCSILKACRDSSLGMQIHGYIVKSGIGRHLWVGSALINMYSNISLPWEAYRVFTMMPQHNQVAYLVMLCCFSRNGLQLEALDLLREMHCKFRFLNKFALSKMIVVCGYLGCLNKGRQLHAHALRVGQGLDISVCNSLITMYSKCDFLEHSLKIFEGMHQRDVFSWNAMILGYVQHGMMDKALQLFRLMMEDGQTKPNEITFQALQPANVVECRMEK